MPGRRTEALADRARRLTWVVLAALGVLLVRISYMQVARGAEYRRQAEERMQLERTLDPRRGQIVDALGRSLVHNALAYDVHVVPSKVTEAALQRLAERLGDLDLVALRGKLEEVRAEALAWMEDDLQRRFGHASPRRQRWARKSLTKYFLRRRYPLVLDIRDDALARELFVEKAAYPGLSVSARAVRRHPRGDSACHLLGYMGRVTAETYPKLRRLGYRPTDWVGKTGLERRYEPQLRGRRGVEVRGRRRRAGRPVILFRDPPRDGQDLALTIDWRLQRVAELALDRRLAELLEEVPPRGKETRGAAAVLVDVRTGAVLASASAPRYEPGRFRRDYKQLLKDPDRPLHDRSRGWPRVPPPGSVFKILTAIAALEEGVADPSFGCVCHGYLHRPGQFRCWNTRGHGAVGLIESIEQSCNITFYKLGERLGGDRMADWGRRFGFGQPTGIELEEKRGTMPEPAWVAFHVGRSWQRADSRFVGIGQGMLETTPLQVARFMAGVANRGALPRLRLLRTTPPAVTQVAVSRQTWEVIEEGMLAVVRSGTASRYGLDRFHVAAKTGTAETGGDRETHAWIGGFAPAHDPQVAFAVMVEHSGHGGEVTGPIVHELLRAFFEPPDDPYAWGDPSRPAARSGPEDEASREGEPREGDGPDDFPEDAGDTPDDTPDDIPGDAPGDGPGDGPGRGDRPADDEEFEGEDVR